MSAIVRIAGEGDIPAIVEAWYAMTVEAGLLAAKIDPDWKEHFAVQLASAMAAGNQRWFVAADAAKGVVATGGAVLLNAKHSIVPLQATIFGMYTDPAFRRQGLARAILTELIAWCEEQECASVRLIASAGGRPLYESLGFRSGDAMVLRLRE